MNLFAFVKSWKDFSFLWTLIQPFILKLLKKNVPTSITKLYENLAKYTQPALDSLHKLKAKIKAEQEYVKYRVIQDENYISDFDKEIKRIKGKEKE